MGWNDGIERKKFETRMKKQAEEYRAAGMTEEQIQAMYEFDLAQYKSDRRFYSHTQSLEVHEFEDDDEGDESDNSLLKKFPEALTATDEDKYFSSTRFGWIESVKNEKLYDYLHDLDDLDLEILTMTVHEGYQLFELSEVLKVPYRTVKFRFAKIKKNILNIF